MNNIKISVIIPVYNAENFLRRCLDSVVKQTLKDIEIICVDDCSTDTSYSILQEYADMDKRIKLYKTEENSGGPSVPKNIALEKASGDFIAFIDNDDYVDNNFYEVLYNLAIKEGADIAEASKTKTLRNNEWIISSN